jgi:hypothetical protein
VYAQYYDDLACLDLLDWSAISARLWSGNDEVREKKQAEFLVHDWCPWSAITEIGVIDTETERRVQAILAAAPHAPPVSVVPDWYY